MLFSQIMDQRQHNNELGTGKNLSFLLSYRSMSLLISVSKPVERIIKISMEEYIEDLNILLEHQFTFRNGLRAGLQALRVVDEIK